MKKIISSLRHGLLSRVWPACARLIVNLFGPRFSAYLSYLAMDWGTTAGEISVLCLGRESFVKDIKELRARTGMNFPMVVGGFTRFQMGWTPPEMQIQTFYQAYQGAGKEQALEKSTQYAKSLILYASRKLQIHAVLSANFDYWQDAGFKRACKELGIPFIVLSRENLVIPKASDEVVDWYLRANYHFDGAAIAVAGRSTKDALEMVGSICRSDQIVVTGLPRFDAWLDVDGSRPSHQRSLVTLLTFTDGYYADDTFKEVLQVFCDAAHRHQSKDVRFLIKTKDVDDTMAVKQMIKKLGCHRVECTHERELFEVLPASRLVINYNSLSLLEAAIARAPILIPAWGQCKDDGADVLYSIKQPVVERVAAFAYTPKQLREAIASSLTAGPSAIDRKTLLEFVNHFVYLPAQGGCSEEFEEFLLRYIKK